MQGVARFDHERGVTLRSAVAGTDPGTVRAVASQLADVMRRRVTLGSVIEALGALQLDTSAPSLDVLRTIGRATVESAADHRATGGRSRFANVDAAVGRTVAISASVWMAADPFTIGAATVPFHATWDMVMPQATTLGVSVVVDGALRQISGAGADGQSIRVEVTGLVTVKGSGVPGNASSESIDPPRQLTLTRSDVGGQSSLAILDEESQVSLGVQWEGPPIEATGGLGQPRASRSARAVAEATKAIRDTLIGRIPPTPPVSSRILATFQAAEDATINQPGNAYRDASIAAVQLLSGLHPDDATFVEDRYAELFPDAGDSGRSLIRPIFDWVLFRRRRREEYEGTSVTTVAGVATVAAWVVRASGEDAATDYRDALMGGKGGVPWSETPVELVQFDMGTATMRSSAEHWRERYRAANGADTILFAGYAKSPLSTEAPVGISRSQALVAATEPLATLSADGRCDLVTRPPAGQMMDDSEGSVFLITYPTDVIEIIAANGVDPKLQDLVSALDAGDADAVAAAPAGATQPLGESAAADSPTQAELAELLDKVNDLRAQWKTGDVETTYRAVVWTQTGLSKARKDSLSTRVDLLIARLNLTTADTTRAEVQFTPDASEVVRLYLVVMPLHLN